MYSYSPCAWPHSWIVFSVFCCIILYTVHIHTLRSHYPPVSYHITTDSRLREASSATVLPTLTYSLIFHSHSLMLSYRLHTTVFIFDLQLRTPRSSRVLLLDDVQLNSAHFNSLMDLVCCRHPLSGKSPS
jgi:hypothetical protein